MTSTCTVSFTRNDLSQTRLSQVMCPVKFCSWDVKQHKVPFQKYKGQMKFLPFCPEHGIRIHTKAFVYYNGPSSEDLKLAIRRNLMFHKEFYVNNFLGRNNRGNKIESKRLCYENSEDAVSYNVFTELLAYGYPLKKLVRYITGKEVTDNVDLYLWGGKIDLEHNSFSRYEPLSRVRDVLETDIRPFQTEPDIMLIVPGKILICIEAKFRSKNPVAKESLERPGEKPKSLEGLRQRYCEKNTMITIEETFDFSLPRKRFDEQIFRNIVFAASMSKLAEIKEWHVVNLRSQHVMHLKRGRPESMPIVRNVRATLQREYKKRFTHLTWETLYEKVVKGDEQLADLTWYMKTKSLNCGRAFNCF
jgi:hypothetical protein